MAETGESSIGTPCILLGSATVVTGGGGRGPVAAQAVVGRPEAGLWGVDLGTGAALPARERGCVSGLLGRGVAPTA